jgi:hypothetical protein
MANRICPICFGKVSVTAPVVHSDGLDCPHCGRNLELSRPSRLLASLVGLLGAAVAFHYASLTMADILDLREWFLPAVASILVFGIVSPLFLLLNADLVVKPDASAEPISAAPAHGHGAHH